MGHEGGSLECRCARGTAALIIASRPPPRSRKRSSSTRTRAVRPSTDMQSILLFLQAPDVDVLGITLVTGDQWIKEQTQRTLRAVEIARRTDVPVVPGAGHPLINTKEESEAWEQQYGESVQGRVDAAAVSRARRASPSSKKACRPRSRSTNTRPTSSFGWSASIRMR